MSTKMAGFFTKCALLIAGSALVAGDYAEYETFVQKQSNNETFVRMFEDHLQDFQDHDQNLKAIPNFKCKAFPQPASKTTSVHKLRAMDIKVVAAMGDSITAGTGIMAKTVIGLLTQYRGLSWSIGGVKTIGEEETIPNMLKVFNSGVTGFSTGSGPVWMESVSRLNVAEPGDKSDAMPGQAVKLVNRMKKEKDVDFEEDWKVITLFVGGNDLCSFCDDREKYSAENYVANIQKALDHLHANVPRAFVNVVEVLDISIVKRLNQNLVCDALHLFLCACAAYPSDSEAEQQLQAETVKYRELTRKLVETGRYDTRDDFTVVVQPFFSKTLPPNTSGTDDKPDLSYFAPDCFHLSLKGHRAATEALWNNMVEPVGKKRESWTPMEDVECPSESAPYFYTRKNSDKSSGLGESSGDQSSDLGEVLDDQHLVREPDSNTGNQDGQHSSSIATITIGTIAIACIMLAIVGIVALRKNRKGREEKEILLKSGHVQAYTEI